MGRNAINSVPTIERKFRLRNAKNCTATMKKQTRLLLHAKQASRTHDHVVIRSPDTDVFILLLGHKLAIPTALYFDTGIGNQRRILDVGKVHLTLGSELCDALIGFHAFTGIHSCDVLSQIY
jgi:hypothetical protein